MPETPREIEADRVYRRAMRRTGTGLAIGYAFMVIGALISAACIIIGFGPK